MELNQMATPTATIADGFDPVKQGNGNGQWNYAAPTPEPVDFDVLFQPPKPDISLLTTAMLDACIVVKEATPTIIASWGLTSRETTPFVHNLPGYVNHDNYDPTDEDDKIALDQAELAAHAEANIEARNISRQSRDITKNTPVFWCIQGVGAYEYRVNWDHDSPTSIGLCGMALHQIESLFHVMEHASFLVFNETIRDLVSTDPEVIRTVSEMNQLVTFHEVLHFFEFIDFGQPGYDFFADGLIMGKGWYKSALLWGYTTLDPRQIQKIQKQLYPK